MVKYWWTRLMLWLDARDAEKQKKAEEKTYRLGD